MALHSAIVLAGGILDGATRRLNRENALAEQRERHNPGGPHFDDVEPASWLFHYDCRPDMDDNL
jgi:hypothetical protein